MKILSYAEAGTGKMDSLNESDVVQTYKNCAMTMKIERQLRHMGLVLLIATS